MEGIGAPFTGAARGRSAKENIAGAMSLTY